MDGEPPRRGILAALFTILLGNPQLKASRDAEGKTRFKMWWRLASSPPGDVAAARPRRSSAKVVGK